MPSVEREKEMEVSSAAIFQAVTNYTDYPSFLPEVVNAEIVSGENQSSAVVEFEIEVIKRFQYRLEFEVTDQSRVSWKLVESNFFKKNDGAWTFEGLGSDKTQVNYQIDIGFGFLVPKWVVRKLTDVSLPKMFENFEERAKSLVGG